MLKSFKRFMDETDGAVTVDFVVLTAAIVGLGLVIITAVTPSVNEKVTYIESKIAE